MKQYLDLLDRILNEGIPSMDRTGVGTVGLFGEQLRFDLRDRFPLLTTKRLHVKSIVHELLWMISGSTNVRYLQDNGVKIWDEWADENGDLGPVYGSQWRNWRDPNQAFFDQNLPNPLLDPFCSFCGLSGSHAFGTIDQLKNVIESIKKNPYGRRHIVSAWNVADVDRMKLPPCHMMYQFYVREGELSCHMYQRSADVFLGVPFNIASYALLTHMVAQVCGLRARELIISFGDVHIYNNHWDQVCEQLRRKPNYDDQPYLNMNLDVLDIDDFKYEDFHFVNYNPQPSIAAPVAV